MSQKNDGREPGPIEETCRALAERLATPEGLRALRREGVAALLASNEQTEPALDDRESAPPTAPKEPPLADQAPAAEPPAGEPVAEVKAEEAPGAPRPISIWHPETRDGETVFVRPPVGPLGDHHATTPVLHPRRGTLPRRICWFGESAAAGYLYAPHRTPAQVIEAQLRAVAGSDRYEVIDLARTNETLGPLVATVESALQLEPDLLVVYAGNNWPLLETTEVSPWVPSVRARQEVAAALGRTLDRTSDPAEGWERGVGPDSEPDSERDSHEASDRDRVRHPHESTVREDERDRETPPGDARRTLPGVAAAVGLARKRLAHRATAALDRLAEIARGAGIPLLLVLPEINLADWENRQPPIWLPGDGSARWHTLFRQALAALEQSDWDAVEQAAWQMNALDGSTNPTPFRLLARAWQAQGRFSDARDAAQAEVDSVHYPLLCCLGAPQATTPVRRLLQDAAHRHDLPTVDLRQVFAEHTGSPLPGRRLFLDYCHLTSEGMRLLGAAVTEQVLRLCPAANGPDATAPARTETRSGARSGADAGTPTWPELAATLPPPDITPEAEATARLGAAVHTAHRHLPLDERARGEMLEHWCAAALDASPGVATALADLAGLRLALLADCPAILTEAFRRLQASPYRMTLQHGLRWGNLDLPVLRAATVALARARHSEAPTVRRLLEDAARRTDPAVDLARDERFLAAPLERPYPEAMDLRDLTGRATLRAVWPETAFDLPVAGDRNLTLELTARLPLIPGVDPEHPLADDRAGDAEILLQLVPLDQGTPKPTPKSSPAGPPPARPKALARRHLTTAWTCTAIHLPTHGLPPGLHCLTIRWPPLPPIGAQALETARRRLELGLEADLHPVFGELASLTVKSR